MKATEDINYSSTIVLQVFAVMEMMRVSFVITAVFALFLALVLPSISAQAPAPAPTSDG